MKIFIEKSISVLQIGQLFRILLYEGYMGRCCINCLHFIVGMPIFKQHPWQRQVWPHGTITWSPGASKQHMQRSPLLPKCDFCCISWTELGIVPNHFCPLWNVVPSLCSPLKMVLTVFRHEQCTGPLHFRFAISHAVRFWASMIYLAATRSASRSWRMISQDAFK